MIPQVVTFDVPDYGFEDHVTVRGDVRRGSEVRRVKWDRTDTGRVVYRYHEVSFLPSRRWVGRRKIREQYRPKLTTGSIGRRLVSSLEKQVRLHLSVICCLVMNFYVEKSRIVNRSLVTVSEIPTERAGTPSPTNGGDVVTRRREIRERRGRVDSRTPVHCPVSSKRS